MPIGSAMRCTNAGTSPKMEQTRPAYLNTPIRSRSTNTASASHSFLSPALSPMSMRSAQNQSTAAISIRSRTYFGSPQA